MQAMAPGRSGDLHAGQTLGAAGVLGAEGGGGAGRGGVGREGVEGAEGGALTAAATGSRAGTWAGTRNTFLHVGQLTCFPISTSGTLIICGQKGHWTSCGMNDS